MLSHFYNCGVYKVYIRARPTFHLGSIDCHDLLVTYWQEMFVLAINSLPQKLNKNISEMTKTDISMVDKTDAKKIQFLKLWETIFNSMFTPVTIPFKKCQQWPAQINRQRRPVVSIVNKLVLFFYSSLWKYLTTGHSQNVPHHMKHHM